MKRIIFALVLVATLVSSADAALEYYIDDESGFNTRVTGATTVTGQSLLLDDGSGIFGAAPTAGTGNASVTRTGTSGGQSFTYTISDVNFKTGQPYGLDGGTLTVGSDILSTSTIAVEAVASQGGASTGDWGVDSQSSPDSSVSGGMATPNAAVFDFTSSATAVDHFGITLLDFEGGFDNGDGVQQSAFIRIYDAANNLVDNQAVNFASPDFGDGEEIHIGVFADGMTISKIVFVLGDDNDSNTANGWGGAEHWAATRFTTGFAANVVSGVPEPSSMALLAIFGMCGLTRRKRRK